MFINKNQPILLQNYHWAASDFCNYGNMFTTTLLKWKILYCRSLHLRYGTTFFIRYY